MPSHALHLPVSLTYATGSRLLFAPFRERLSKFSFSYPHVQTQLPTWSSSRHSQRGDRASSSLPHPPHHHPGLPPRPLAQCWRPRLHPAQRCRRQREPWRLPRPARFKVYFVVSFGFRLHHAQLCRRHREPWRLPPHAWFRV